MKLLVIMLLSCASAFAQNSWTIYEGDGSTQTAQPRTKGITFKQGEIALCPQPKVGGVAVSAGNWQADVKNRWTDGSVKFAVISFISTISANSSIAVTFQSATCVNTGYLTQAQMTNFNSGNWNSQTLVTANGTTVTTDAKTMLAANDPETNTFGDCKNDYWLQGAVVTAVILQDCTATTAFDFGWSWNGTTMTSPTGSSHTASTASLHPMFILYFYPSINAVQSEHIMENPWSGRGQDQQYSFVLKDGTALTTTYTHSLYTMLYRQRWRKTFWSGTAPGQDFVDYNWAYLVTTLLLPYYDTTKSASPDTANSGSCSTCTSYAAWQADANQGDIGLNSGMVDFSQDYSANSEGAPIQREDLLYLTNMGTCGTINGLCRKAWNENTGQIGANPSNTLTIVSAGGAGMWNYMGNVPYHMRESRTAATGQQSAGTNFFYCSGFADKNAAGNSTTCSGSGATNVATGRPMSRHGHSDFTQTTAIRPLADVGTVTIGSWNVADASHWWDATYVAYLLTGDYYYLEDEYYAGSYVSGASNADNQATNSNGFFAFSNTQQWIPRILAWSLQTQARAATIAPDGSIEATFYTALVNSNIEVQEGMYGLTGTPLTPTSTNPTCSPYTLASANRWDWGRCTTFSQLTTTGTPMTVSLHAMEIGFCPVNSEGTSIMNPSNTESETKPWMENFFVIVGNELREMGFSNMAAASTQSQQRLEEIIGDSNFNAYLSAAYQMPAVDASGGSCASHVPSGALMTTWARMKAGFSVAAQAVTTFDSSVNTGNFPCGDHAYSLIARAAAADLVYFGTSSTDAACTAGTCTAAATWTWLNTQVPYFNNSPPASSGCSTGDEQIKFALASRSPATSGAGSTIQGSTFKGSIITLMLTHQPFHARLSLTSE